MADFKPGEMDVTVQEKTFAGFINFTKYSVVVIICTLIFMALVNS